jgi:hypothetical protein
LIDKLYLLSDRANPGNLFSHNISESTVFVQACQYGFAQILISMMVLGNLRLDALLVHACNLIDNPDAQVVNPSSDKERNYASNFT